MRLVQVFVDFDLSDQLINFAAPKQKTHTLFVLFYCVCFSAMDSHAVSSPTIFGPLSSMFSQEARDAILAEERAELQQQQIDIDAMQAATAVDSSIADTSVVTEVLGPVGLPVQHGSAERVTPEAAAPESMDPVFDQESVRQTRRSPSRASTPSGATSRATRGGKATGTSPPATQADLRAVQVELALLIAGHTTEIAQLQSTVGALEATATGASSDFDELRAQISSHSDAMTASEERLINMMSPLIEQTHTTAERLTELDLQMKAMRIELRQRPSQPQQYDVHTPSHPGRTVGADDPWQPRPEAGRQQAPRASAAPSAGGLGHDSSFASPHPPWAPSNDSHSSHSKMPTLCRLPQLRARHRTVWAARPVNSHLRMAMVFPSRKISATSSARRIPMDFISSKGR